jgi:FixJ family two-component response regulator
MLDVIEESPHRWRIALVDDDPSALRATARLLTVDGYDVSAFSSAGEFLESLATELPDVLLVDLRMPVVNGLELQAAVRERKLFLPMIFMSAYASVASSVQALRGGAVDFLEKPYDRATLLAALERAIELAARERKATSMRAELVRSWQTLTRREQEVCRWVVRGLLNKQIAAAIGTGEKTVKVHRARAMSKLRADSVASLVRMVDSLEVPDSATATAPSSDERQRAG